MSTLPTLAVVLIVKNEADILARCLDSTQGLADEIVILDSGSTDQTEAVARRYTDKFYCNTDWQGFGKQRQLAQQYATADWILWLDADEQITPDLAHSVRAVLTQAQDPSSSANQTVYEVARLSWAYGQFIRHGGWYPGYVKRLYRRTFTQFNDNLVHESVIVPTGSHVVPLTGDLLHYTYRNSHEYLMKAAHYAHAWAQQRFEQGKKASITQACLHAVSRFFRMYLLKGGCLDGRAGFLLAVFAAQSVFNKHIILYLKSHHKDQADT